jgi:hypothetical protein
MVCRSRIFIADIAIVLILILIVAEGRLMI